MKQRIAATISTTSTSNTMLEQLSMLAPHGEVYFYTDIIDENDDVRVDVTVAKLEDTGVYYTIDDIMLPTPVLQERTWTFIGW